MPPRTFYVYIFTNEMRTVLYSGVSNDLHQSFFEYYQNRGQQHSFCGRYNVYSLLYYKEHLYISDDRAEVVKQQLL